MNANNTETATYRPATLFTSGTHEFPKAGALQFICAFLKVVSYGVFSTARDAILRR